MKKHPVDLKGGVSRITISLPAALLDDLDRLVAQRGYSSRSQAVAEVVNAQIVESRRELGNDVMVGTITLHYDRSVRGLQGKLADLQYAHIDEVISSLHVHLSENQVMEVILVQGRARRLQDIANQMLTRRGVFGGRLQLHAAVIPPIQLPVKKVRPKDA
jgi:CopG family nickel-responsive transcriptional regulator